MKADQFQDKNYVEFFFLITLYLRKKTQIKTMRINFENFQLLIDPLLIYMQCDLIYIQNNCLRKIIQISIKIYSNYNKLQATKSTHILTMHN